MLEDLKIDMAHRFVDDVRDKVAEGLPSSSAIVGKVIKTIFDASSSAADLAAVIENDPPLTAKILKISNSAYYGAATTITSLKRAIVVLGFDTIKELVMAVSVKQSFFTESTDSSIDHQGLWLHSVGTAKGAQLISQRLNIERPDVTYTVGLLHDIGKILLALCFPAPYSRVIDYARENKTRIIDAERRMLNTDHAMIGKILCDIWDLPESLCMVILYHHDPEEISGGDRSLARLVHMGDYMCRRAEIGETGDTMTMKPSPAMFSIFGDNAADIREKYNSIYREFLTTKTEIEDFFSSLK